MTGKVLTGRLHRVQAGHGKRFVTEAPVRPAPVRRPARVALMLALAHKIERAIEGCKVENQAETARRLGLSAARVSQLLALLRLAPDLQEQVLSLESINGLERITERDLRLIIIERAWAAQRALFHALIATRPPMAGQVTADGDPHEDGAVGVDGAYAESETHGSC